MTADRSIDLLVRDVLEAGDDPDDAVFEKIWLAALWPTPPLIPLDAPLTTLKRLADSGDGLPNIPWTSRTSIERSRATTSRRT